MPVLDQFDIDENTLHEWRQFVGSQADYYIQSWMRIKQGQFFGFNLHAFVFNIFWLLYRQMFKSVILILSIFFAMSFLEKIAIVYFPIVDLPFNWIYIKIFLFALFIGYSGNWLYLWHTEEAIRQVKSNYPKEDQARMIVLKGGVSYIPVTLFSIILLLSILINFVHPDNGLNFNTFVR